MTVGCLDDSGPLVGESAAVSFETTAVRLWKRLSREERLAAATAFWDEPPEALVGTALGAIAKARHLRPQVARALGQDERVRALAPILDPGEVLASTLLVSLHIGQRRGLLAAFLDALGLPHEDGILKEDDAVSPPLGEAEARKAVAALRASFPKEQVFTYLNTLWLQDPARWAALGAAPGWLDS
jgi:hypothetical protein